MPEEAGGLAMASVGSMSGVWEQREDLDANESKNSTQQSNQGRRMVAELPVFGQFK